MFENQEKDLHTYVCFAAGLTFSRKHPLSLWLSSMLVIFSGSVIANALMGEPILTPFKNNNAIVLATAVW